MNDKGSFLADVARLRGCFREKKMRLKRFRLLKWIKCASKYQLFQDRPGIYETRGAFNSTKNSENFETEENGAETLLGKMPEIPTVLNRKLLSELLKLCV